MPNVAMSALVLLGVVGMAAGAVLVWFWHLERTGRGVVVLTVLLGVLVVEGSLYPGFDAPAGLFHPTWGTQSFRPYEVLIVLAVLARLLAMGAPTRIGPQMLWWLAFMVWMCVAAFVGIYVGHDGILVAFEAKAVIYLGAMVLAAGIPAHEYVRGKAVGRFIEFAAVVATVMIVLDGAGVRLSGVYFGVPVEETGRMGSDAASIFLALGILAAARAVSGGPGRFRMLLAACPLVLSTFVPYQRAVLLSFAVLVLVLPVAFLTASARARLQASTVELTTAGLLLLTLITLPWVLSGLQGKDTPKYPLAPRVAAALTDRSKQLSAQDRVNQYEKAWPLILEKPLLGWGLGKTYAHFHPGPDIFEENNLTHNIAGDLLLRTGLAGLLLFGVAFWLGLRDGWRVWREHADDAVACVALACVIVLAGLAAKGMAESLFEKFRLAVLIGVFLGILRSVVTSRWNPSSAPLSGAPEATVAPGSGPGATTASSNGVRGPGPARERVGP